MNFLKLRLSQQTLGLTLAEVMIVRATCQKELVLKFDMLERESFNRVLLTRSIEARAFIVASLFIVEFECLMPSDHSYRIPANERHALIYILFRKSTHPLGHNDKQAPFSNKLLPLSRTNIYYGQVVGCWHENTTAPLLLYFLK